MSSLISTASFALLGLYSTHLLAEDVLQTAPEPTTTVQTPATSATPTATPAVIPTPSDTPDTPAPKKRHKEVLTDSSVPKVVISGAGQTDLDVRRQSTASKIIIGREELDRDGDSSVGEILKRLPGVTVGGKPGRGGDIRMRGMGSGYTQILVNGERMPRGFSLDTLSPDQVERIEIIRAPVAEFTTQAVAGIINIVLREDYKQKDTQLRLSDGVEQGRNAPNLSISTPGEIGQLSYTLSGSIFQNRRRDEAFTDNLINDEPGQKIVDQDIGVTNGVHLTPRFEYKFSDSDKLVMQPFVMFANTQTNGTSVLDQLNDQVAPYQNAVWHTGVNSFVSRLFTNYTHRLEDGAKLELKLGTGKSENSTITDRVQTGDATGYQDLLTTSHTEDFNTSVGAKYSKIFSNGHSLVTGVSADWTRRNETEVATDNGAPTFDNSGDNLSAGIRQLAGFVQDEWDINPNWAANAGLRWEGIQTTSTLPTGEILNQSSVWSPLLHLVYRIPDTKDQIRMSATHSYRPPVLNDLIALPALSQNNSPISPDRIGNPNLKPELANGIDVGYEHYISHSGILAANFFYREIHDLMRHEVSLVDGRWVSAPVNLANAQTHGIELEAKFDIVDFFPEAPAISLRSNYSHFWSQVADIQGPNNRIDQQPSQTANLGMDYKMATLPLTLGGSVNWTPAYIVQSSTTQGNTIGLKRQLDMYALWKFSASSQLRFAVNNLVNSDYLTSTFSTLGYPEVSTVVAPTYTTYTLRWELKY
ncbi:TonB-dependent receptor plug domain-containing protein [Solimicrobium silvestre]|uniref:TonB-dependent Receptor Plug Domain n=1 Tax=Solimicrobium silvestre TaxID=2099400 RepID=A0A2S9H1K2_9BURK|nr:TonB-dependent receptor [Solimicrobium silvestre]PRC93837.1 TonB-dependent Receptor Plug Domain [Solimicrobium silvestre]